MKEGLDKTPPWLWATILLMGVSLAGFGVLFFGYAGTGNIRVTVSAVNGKEEIACTVEIDYSELSKSTDHAKGCLKWQAANCAVSFSSPRRVLRVL